MAILQLFSIWLIVGTTIVWFVRDEKRLYEDALSIKAMQFAKAPHYRRPAPDEIFGM